MSTFTITNGNLVGTSEDLRVTYDMETGGLRQVENCRTEHKLLQNEQNVPWRMKAVGSQTERMVTDDAPDGFEENVPEPTEFGVTISDDASHATLSWDTTNDDIEVIVESEFGDGGELELWPRVNVGSGVRPPLAFTYPVLSNPQPLSAEDHEDKLVFPLHSGWLIRDPLEHDPLMGSYPNGIGCSMQFTAYYETAEGGFYLATHDPHATWKYLAFGPHEWSFRHDTWDLRRGTSIEYDYPIIVAPLEDGDWYAAADRYRDWAHSDTPWTASGEKDGATSRQECSWLYEDVGLALWGSSSSLDWSPFYEFYEEVADTPLHICSGWDWPATRPHTVGKEGWFPADFHPENLEIWEDHYVTPYTNDSFISSTAEGFLDYWEPNLTFPYSEFSFASFSKPHPDWIDGDVPDPDPAITTDTNFFLCPATDSQQDLHAWRATRMVDEYPLEGACYDISSGIPIFTSRCWRSEHGHPPGRGREIVTALGELNRHSRAVTAEETGDYLVQGVETIVETIIDSVDFHVSRGASGPLGVLEAWLPAPEEPPGTGRELLPLFEAVYHDIGPVRHDGWLSLRDDIGDLWFWIAARIVLRWGGLFSLEYALNPPEQPPGYEGPAESVDWGGATIYWDTLPDPDPEKIDFMRELANARTELATEYLSHGRLLRPIPVDVDMVALEYEQQALWKQLPAFENKGTWDVPAVVHGVWEAPNGLVGLLFAVVGEEPRHVDVTVDCGDLWDIEVANRPISKSVGETTEELGSVERDNTLEMDLELAPRTVTLIEIGE